MKQNGQRGVLLARAPQRFQTGKAGHPHVGDHHVEFAGAQRFQGAFAGVHHHGFEALAPEKGIEQAALPGIVIDNQDARRFTGALAGFGRHGSNLSESGHHYQAGAELKSGLAHLISMGNGEYKVGTSR